MTGRNQLPAVASRRQGQPRATATRAVYTAGRSDGVDGRAGVPAPGRDRSADGAGLAASCAALAGVRGLTRLEIHIRRLVDAAPPLTAEQRDTLALLLGEATPAAHGAP